jgi:hypothetical protein
MHLADGREIPAKLILRDQDLDLAFVKPVQPPSPPLNWVDAPAARASLLDLLFVIQRTSESNGWSTAAAFGSVQLVLDKPRVYYQVAMPVLGGSALGSPVFDAAGRFVGVVMHSDRAAPRCRCCRQTTFAMSRSKPVTRATRAWARRPASPPPGLPARADAVDLLDGHHEDLPVADVARVRAGKNRLNGRVTVTATRQSRAGLSRTTPF